MFVSRFQQPMSKKTMNADIGNDDSYRKFIPPLFLCSSLLHLRFFGGVHQKLITLKGVVPDTYWGEGESGISIRLLVAVTPHGLCGQQEVDRTPGANMLGTDGCPFVRPGSA
jgi:hypothetical protein